MTRRAPPPDGGLGKPKRKFDETFSAETLLLDYFFPGEVAKAQADTTMSAADFARAKHVTVRNKVADIVQGAIVEYRLQGERFDRTHAMIVADAVLRVLDESLKTKAAS